MFDISYSKILILAAIALIVIGPKDLPRMLRTVGKYLGMIKRQAAEFRSQFDEAMRDSELADLKKEIETLGQEAHSTLTEAERSMQEDVRGIESEFDKAAREFDRPAGETPAPVLTSDTDAAIALSPAETEPLALNGAATDHLAGGPKPPEIAFAPAPKPAPPALETAAGEATPRTGA